MKIIQVFPGKIWGGAEQYILDLGRALEQKGHNVIYVALPYKAVTSRLSKQQSLICLPFRNRFDRHTVTELASLLQDADIIHIHDIRFLKYVIRAKKQSKSETRIILTRHIARKSIVMPWNRHLFKAIYKMIFVSELAKKLWFTVNPWMDNGKCTVILNSVLPASDGKQESIRHKFHIPYNEQLIVFTGRIRKSKGCETIIKALSRLTDYKYHMVFIGACKPAGYDKKLMKIAQQSKISDRIHFYGFSPNVRLLIKEADIGIAPSIVKEACPLSPMEFMQAGKCIITSDNGAQSEYIHSGENGILVAPSDVDNLTRTLKQILESPEERLRLGQMAMKFFKENLTYSKFICNILNVYG